jgi:hypothetical protein
MRFIRRLHAVSPAFFLAVGGVVLSAMLFAMAMAASAELHHHLHPDADHEDHECAVTHLMAGSFGDVAGPPRIDVAPLFVRPEIDERGVDEEAVLPLYLKNGVLEHAPPA